MSERDVYELIAEMRAKVYYPATGSTLPPYVDANNIAWADALESALRDRDRRIEELQRINKINGEMLAREDVLNEQTIDERDRAEDVLTKLAALANCQLEWSNLHHHGECIARALAREASPERKAFVEAAEAIAEYDAKWDVAYATTGDAPDRPGPAFHTAYRAMLAARAAEKERTDA